MCALTCRPQAQVRRPAANVQQLPEAQQSVLVRSVSQASRAWESAKGPPQSCEERKFPGDTRAAEHSVRRSIPGPTTSFCGHAASVHAVPDVFRNAPASGTAADVRPGGAHGAPHVAERACASISESALPIPRDTDGCVQFARWSFGEHGSAVQWARAAIPRARGDEPGAAVEHVRAARVRGRRNGAPAIPASCAARAVGCATGGRRGPCARGMGGQPSSSSSSSREQCARGWATRPSRLEQLAGAV